MHGIFHFNKGGARQLQNWVAGLTPDTAEEAYKTCRTVLDMCIRKDPKQKEDIDSIASAVFDYYNLRSWASYPQERTREAQWPEKTRQMLRTIERFIKNMEEYNQTAYGEFYEYNGVQIGHIWIGNRKKGLCIPNLERYGTVTEQRDYSSISPNALRLELGMEEGKDELLPAGTDGSMTSNELQAQKQTYEQELHRINEDYQSIRDGEYGELAAIKEEINKKMAELKAKQEELMAQLEDKKAEMELMKDRLEAQIFLLDSQIYSILCYMGETVKFAQIRSGKSAPITEPIVLHQKLRFLDEDLGRLASLYCIDWDELDEFERFLRYSPAALEAFAPNERCIMLVRLSKTGTIFGIDDRPYTNMLKDYDYYHGHTVGIIIRNGENLYLGWTDENRVHIEDDLIISRVITDVAPGEEESCRSIQDARELERKKRREARGIMDGLVSRTFVYNILQGVVDHSTILPSPEGIKLNRQSEYVIYAVADKWLTDTRFGSFDKIIEESNKRVNEGDMILTVQRLSPIQYRAFGGRAYGLGTWENSRGRGDRNRTHDCTIEDKTIYPVNLVEYEEPVKKKRYRFYSGKNPDGTDHYVESVALAESKLDEDTCEVLEYFDYVEDHIYISIEKRESRWRVYDDGPLARANVEVYRDEFINLTYLNSVLLTWVINNKTLGGWTAGGKVVNYAYAIQYLNIAMDFIRKREATEKEYIDAVNPEITLDPEWPLKLTEWKKSAGVRNITPYQAKRFAKALKKA